MLKRILNIWKTLRLPWRRQILVGSDLFGNEYYESIKPIMDNGRTKRIVYMKKKGIISDYIVEDIPELILSRAKKLDKEWEESKNKRSSLLANKDSKKPLIPSDDYKPEGWTPPSKSSKSNN
nr:8086_t:CDS:2 [Entrophospora candida]CAG8436461.1 9984_t:CDS:2 [Entrophospora candida]